MVRRLTSERREGVFTKSGRRKIDTLQIRSDRRQGVSSGKNPQFKKRDTVRPRLPNLIVDPIPAKSTRPSPLVTTGGALTALAKEGKTFSRRRGVQGGREQQPEEQGFISRFAQAAGTTLGKFTTPISNLIGKGLEKVGIVDEFNAVTPEEFGESTGGKIVGTAASLVGGEIAATALVGGASFLLGGKLALKTAPRLLEFATGGKIASKALTPATRAAQNLNKAFRAGKISSKNVGKISKRIDNMRTVEVIEQLTQKKGIGKILTKNGPTILFSSGIAQWYAADNMSSGSKIASTQVINQVRFGQLSKEDGLAAINRAQFFNGLAIATVVGAMVIAPPMAPLGIILLPGMIGDGVQINLNEGIVERL